MNSLKSFPIVALATLLTVMWTAGAFAAEVPDIRGVWVGKAKGPVFGAEGSVNIRAQDGGNIEGIVEGGNFLGKARFTIRGKITGNVIHGSKDGNVFQGFLYSDATIRGTMRAINGEVYHVFLRRSYPYWQASPYNAPSQMPYADPYGGSPYYQGVPYGTW